MGYVRVTGGAEMGYVRVTGENRSRECKGYRGEQKWGK
jgi:hypothetical protein